MKSATYYQAHTTSLRRLMQESRGLIRTNYAKAIKLAQRQLERAK